MVILSIETSCDETAVSVVEATGDFPHATYKILGNALFSQIEIHREYGGVFPNIAKREHAKTLTPMLKQALNEAGMLKETASSLPQAQIEELQGLLIREDGLADTLTTFFEAHEKPPIDLISVTYGPGLEPTLWVGINFAKALSSIWGIPLVPVNHMEGHVLSSVFDGEKLQKIAFPALVLLVSGGHTELLEMKDWHTYTLLGQTRDDAVGEAFDKVARMLGFPYPGGPEISRLAQSAREKNLPPFADLPKPMLDSKDHDFSFSGLKTAVRNVIEDRNLNDEEKAALARDFEDAVVHVLLKKAAKAFDHIDAQTLILGGGVTANNHLRESFAAFFSKEYPDVSVYLPKHNLATDNAIMVALAGHAHADMKLDKSTFNTITAQGNASIAIE